MLTRLVRLISTKTNEYFFGRHLFIRSIIIRIRIYDKNLETKETATTPNRSRSWFPFYLGLDIEPSTLDVTRTLIEKDNLGDESPDEDC